MANAGIPFQFAVRVHEGFKACYLPAEMFGWVESEILRQRRHAYKLLTYDEVVTDKDCFAFLQMAWLASLDEREKVRSKCQIYFCLQDAKTSPHPSVMRLQGGDSYCVFLTIGVFEGVRRNAMMLASYLPICSFFALTPPIFTIPADGFDGWMTIDAIREEVDAPRDNYFPFFWIGLCAIVHHEMGHIVCGHLDFLEDYREDIAKNSEKRPLLNRTLEFDADCYAAVRVFDRLRNPGLPVSVTKILKDRNDIVVSALASLTCAFQFQNLYEIVHHYPEEARHPPLRWRMLGAWNTIHAVLEKESGGDLDTATQILKEGVELASMYIRATSPDLNGDLWNHLFGAAEQDRRIEGMKQHLSVWAAVRPLLTEYNKRHCELAAPQSEPHPAYLFLAGAQRARAGRKKQCTDA